MFKPDSLQCESNNFTSLRFSDFSKQLTIFNYNIARLLHVHIYAELQTVIQLAPTLTKLCRIKHDR